MGMLKKIVRNCKRSKDKPVDKEIDEDSGGTTGIEEDAEVSGTFPTADPPCVLEELKGARGLMDEVPPDEPCTSYFLAAAVCFFPVFPPY